MGDKHLTVLFSKKLYMDEMSAALEEAKPECVVTSLSLIYAIARGYADPDMVSAHTAIGDRSTRPQLAGIAYARSKDIPVYCFGIYSNPVTMLDANLLDPSLDFDVLLEEDSLMEPTPSERILKGLLHQFYRCRRDNIAYICTDNRHLDIVPGDIVDVLTFGMEQSQDHHLI